MHRIHLNIRRLELALAAALIVSLGLSAAGAAPVARDCASIQQKVVRLHILANSDSDADQAQKLRVRDRVLAETGDALAHTTSRAEAEAALPPPQDARRRQAGAADRRAQGRRGAAAAAGKDRGSEDRAQRADRP